jgi:hypothetical protein
MTPLNDGQLAFVIGLLISLVIYAGIYRLLEYAMR